MISSSRDLHPSQVSAQATVLVLAGAHPQAALDVPDGQWELDGRVLRVGYRPHSEWVRRTLSQVLDENLGEIAAWAGVEPTWRERVTGEALLARLSQQAGIRDRSPVRIAATPSRGRAALR